MKNLVKFVALFIAITLCACGNLYEIDDFAPAPKADAAPQDSGAEADARVDSALPDVQVDVQSDAQNDVQSDVSGADSDAHDGDVAHVPTLMVELDAKLLSQEMYYKRFAEVFWFKLHGDSSVEQTIDTLCFTHTGSGSLDEIESVALSDENFARLAMNDPVPDPVTGRACFEDLGLKVSANVILRVRLISFNRAINIGGEHAFSIVDPGDIGTIEDVQVKGQFPIQGPTMTMSDLVPELIYSYAGTSSDLEFEADEPDPSIYEFNANALRYQMHANAIPVFVVSRDGGLIRGSKGTFYLDRFQVWEGNVPIGDPIELDPTTVDVGAQGVYFSIHLFNGIDIFLFPPGVTKKLYVTFEHPMAEDVPGEFFGHQYRLEQKLPGTYNDVLNYDFADLLEPGQVWPQADIQGSLRRILAP